MAERPGQGGQGNDLGRRSTMRFGSAAAYRTGAPTNRVVILLDGETASKLVDRTPHHAAMESGLVGACADAEYESEQRTGRVDVRCSQVSRVVWSAKREEMNTILSDAARDAMDRARNALSKDPNDWETFTASGRRENKLRYLNEAESHLTTAGKYLDLASQATGESFENIRADIQVQKQAIADARANL